MSSKMMISQGAVLATAVALSGTVILLAFRLQKSFPTPPQFSFNSLPQSPSSTPPPSCLSTPVGKKREKKKKKKKKVQFAEDVVDPSGDSEVYRKLHSNNCHGSNASSSSTTTLLKNSSTTISSGTVQSRMPANRVALYNGILRDRVLHRVPYSY